uniref:Myb/SANT-like DNA-binding domain-containing protein n=1 Tax=Bactrocera dorsalis TaxID=27457 RepID=A0A034WQY6_BACDO
MWNEAAEDDLIKLWQAKMPQLRSVRQYRQPFVYEEMAKAMESLGHEYTTAEIKVKLYEFTNKYKQEQQKIGPSSWKHFTAVHEALGGFCFDELVEDSILVDIENIEPIYEDCESECQSTLSISDASSSDSSNHSSSSDTAVSVMEEMREIFLKAIQTWKESKEKEQILLQEYVNDVREMQQAFIDFLRRQN